MIRDGDKYLLIKRAANPDKGLWSVPGGLVEVGERIQEAAIREAKEETCLNVKLVERLGVVDKIEYDESGEVYYHFIIIPFFGVITMVMEFIGGINPGHFSNRKMISIIHYVNFYSRKTYSLFHSEADGTIWIMIGSTT